MSLKKIIADIVTTHGIAVSNAGERAWLIDRINDAARELWTNQDLPNSLKEQYVGFEDQKEVITLPWYVGEVRGIRRPCWNDRDPITLHDLRPRYHLNSWGDVRSDSWRVIGTKATKANIASVLPISFKICSPEPGPITFTIRGMLISGTMKNLQVTLPEGNVEISMPNDFAEIEYITKDRVTECNVSVFSGNMLIAELISSLERSRYIAIQVADNCYYPIEGDCGKVFIDVLYKPTFLPMFQDEDCFQVDGYDKIIVYKFAELEADDPSEMSKFAGKADQQLEKLADSTQRGKQTKANFGRNYALDTYRAVTNPYFYDNGIYGRY